MRTLGLLLLALGALAAGALAAGRALDAEAEPRARLVLEEGRPLFVLGGLRAGDRAARCVEVRNEGPGEAAAAVLGRHQDGDLAALLRVAVVRGCGSPATLLFSGALADLHAAADPAPWPAGERREYRIAIEVGGSDAEVQGRRAVHEFAFAADAAAAAATAASGQGEQTPYGRRPASPCTTITLAPSARAGSGRHPVLVKRRRVGGRVTAKLILRIYGAPGRQRLVLVTRLRIAGDEVLMGRRWGRVAYRVGAGAAVRTRRRPFRVRVAPGALLPGRNVVRVRLVPRGGRAVRARYVLTVAGPGDGRATCVIG